MGPKTSRGAQTFGARSRGRQPSWRYQSRFSFRKWWCAPSDPGRARALLAKAAEANSAEAQYQLGLMNADGVGGPKDDVAARALFEKAASQDHAGAMERMGAFAESGRGGPQDSAAAKAYYEKAAVLGSETAKTALKRVECPYVIKDKNGKFVTNLCFRHWLRMKQGKAAVRRPFQERRRSRGESCGDRSRHSTRRHFRSSRLRTKIKTWSRNHAGP